MSAWVERMRDVTITALAPELGITSQGYKQTPSGWTLGPCPACQTERRHYESRGDKRGALGVGKGNPHGWHCFACEASGDALDLVAYALGGARMRELDVERKAEVRSWCSRYLGLDQGDNSTLKRPIAAPPVKVEPPKYLAPADVDALWTRCASVNDDPEVAAWLRDARGIDPKHVAALDLARVAPSTDLPRWAGYKRKGGDWFSWPSQRLNLVVRLFDTEGGARSMLFRRSFETKEKWPPKSVGAYEIGRAGLVMANGLGAHLLRFGINSANGLDVVIAEGEMDFLTAAVLYAPADEERACFGIVQGSWNRALADRVPRGSKVTVLSHDDGAGQKYVEQIASTLANRCTVQNRVCR